MKKNLKFYNINLISVIMALIMFITSGQAMAQFSGGVGTEENPWQVATLEELQAIGETEHLDKHFIQMAEIDASETAEWNDGQGFEPIGNNTSKFNGTFDGNGFKIMGLVIARPDNNRNGMFGEIGEGTVINTILENVTITGGSLYAGSLAGYNSGTILNTNATGVVEGESVGGLVGMNRSGGEIIDSYAMVDVTGTRRVGGLISDNFGNVKNSHATGNVSASHHIIVNVGGLIGSNRGSVENSYAIGNVTGSAAVWTADVHTGGLIGENYAMVSNSFAEGSVTGIDGTGGLIGVNNQEVHASHASGNVSGRFRVGGLIGENNGPVSHSFASGDVTGDENQVGGLIGLNSNGTIQASHAAGDVAGRSEVGGLAGKNEEGGIEQVYATGSVTGENEVGGLIGRNDAEGIVERAYAINTVSGSEAIGGLIGINSGTISVAHAISDVSGGVAVGGLVGINRNAAEITATYAAGTVHGEEDAGGLVGVNGAGILESYWDYENTQQPDAVGRGHKGDVVGLKVSQMTGKQAIENMSFVSTEGEWVAIAGEYPRLLWSVSYFIITDMVAEGTIPEGGIHEVILTLENIGGSNGNEIIRLINQKEQVVDSLDLALEAGESAQIMLRWQSEAGDAGSYVFEVHSKSEKRSLQLTVTFFAGGSGSKEDPYQIATIDQLQHLRYHPDDHFIQISDINAAETADWNEEAGFKPIGDDLVSFKGSFNGNGYEIDSLTINAPESFRIGLFGRTEETTIVNVGLKNVFITGSNTVGSLVGEMFNGTVRNSYVTGGVITGRGIGGLIGRMDSTSIMMDSHAHIKVISNGGGTGGLIGSSRGEIHRSHATGNLIFERNYGGGLVGSNLGNIYDSYASVEIICRNSGPHGPTGEFIPCYAGGGLVGSNRGEIHRSFATGNVSPLNDDHEFRTVGGLVGSIQDGRVYDSYATGNVTGYENVGGLVGVNSLNSLIETSYALGNVHGENAVGGLVGLNSHGEIVQVYASGHVIGSNRVGGLIGDNWAEISSGYWDSETSEQSKGVGNGSDGTTGLTTSQMTGMAAEESMSDFAFNEKWIAVPGRYPVHPWEFVRPVVLNSPVNGREEYDVSPDFTWYRQDSAATYHIQISTDRVFSELVFDSSAITDSVFTLNQELSGLKEYYWRVRGLNGEGYPGAWSSKWSFITKETVSNELHEKLPHVFSLSQNYPNPFNPGTVIEFGLPEAGEVTLEVYNLLGQRVASLVREYKSAGWYQVSWDGSNLASGMYIYRLQAGDFVQSRQMILVK